MALKNAGTQPGTQEFDIALEIASKVKLLERFRDGVTGKNGTAQNRSPTVTKVVDEPPSNIEQEVSQWIDASKLSRKILVDEKMYFGFQVSLPPRIIISILHPKKRPSYLMLNSRIRMSDTQRAWFDKMS
jgi:Uncharacterized conserved protein (DUF2299)